MSLSDLQQHQLHCIEAGLRRSDPHLGAMFAVFGRLYAGEGMPAGEQLPSGPGRPEPASWIAAVLTAVAAVLKVLLAAASAAVTATWRTRAAPPGPDPGRSRPGGEAGDQQDPPVPA
jgi:Protein of unknown function (DUF3040)